MTRYRTIVADPPWPVSRVTPRHFAQRRRSGEGVEPMPYETMSVGDIKALPVADFAEDDAHLYLWTINAFLPETYEVARAWGFKPSTMLVWAKAPRGIGMGGAFSTATEYVLFCRRGSLSALTRVDSNWFQWKRPYDSRGPIHSAKPDAFYDLVEQISPGPRLEMFARRGRLGWDYWGDESLNTVELGSSGGSQDAETPLGKAA